MGVSVIAPVDAGESPSRADRVHARGLDIYYEVYGDLSSHEPPVLLLHGGMGSIGTDFAQLLPALARFLLRPEKMLAKARAAEAKLAASQA